MRALTEWLNSREKYIVMMMRHRAREGLDLTRSDGGLEAFLFSFSATVCEWVRIEQKNMNIHIHNTHEICTRNVRGGSTTTEKITKSARRSSSSRLKQLSLKCLKRWRAIRGKKSSRTQSLRQEAIFQHCENVESLSQNNDDLLRFSTSSYYKKRQSSDFYQYV